jgi:aminoglycoside 6'-N-acetyltransferase I
MQILNLTPDDTATIEQVAALLVEGFVEQAPDAWPDLASALQEVRESFASGRMSLVALDAQGRVIGWIGGIEQYEGHVWELHPLVVDAAHRRQGVGRALVAALEERLRVRGVLTLWLGTDDETGQTTLSGVNLYPDVWTHIAAIRNLRGHPYEFYQRLGFVITGIMPDANGPGKPDIFMAKALHPTNSGP